MGQLVFLLGRAPTMCCVIATLLSASLRPIAAQDGSTSAPPMAWRAWGFGRLGDAIGGPSHTDLRHGLLSVAGGAVASYGTLVGIVRVADSEILSFADSRPRNGVHDYAVLAGVRSRGSRVFLTGTAGVAQADDNPQGEPDRHLGLAYDLSAHANYIVGGLAVAVSGVVGPARTSYIALTVGAELGWFGR